MASDQSIASEPLSGVMEPTVPQGLEFRRARPSDLSGIEAIADARFGSGFLDAAAIESPDVEAFCALERDRVVGFCFAQVWTVDSFARENPRLAGIDVGFSVTAQLAHIESVAIAVGYEGRGVAARLAWVCFSELVARGIRHFIVSAWTSRSQGTHVAGLLELAAFRFVVDLPSYWSDFRDCPECRPAPCRCVCSVYTRVLPD